MNLLNVTYDKLSVFLSFFMVFGEATAQNLSEIDENMKRGATFFDTLAGELDVFAQNLNFSVVVVDVLLQNLD